MDGSTEHLLEQALRRINNTESRVRTLEALAQGQQVTIQHLQDESLMLRDQLELLEDSLEARRAMEEHLKSGAKAIPWDELRIELGLPAKQRDRRNQ